MRDVITVIMKLITRYNTDGKDRAALLGFFVELVSVVDEDVVSSDEEIVSSVVIGDSVSLSEMLEALVAEI